MLIRSLSWKKAALPKKAHIKSLWIAKEHLPNTYRCTWMNRMVLRSMLPKPMIPFPYRHQLHQGQEKNHWMCQSQDRLQGPFQCVLTLFMVPFQIPFELACQDLMNRILCLRNNFRIVESQFLQLAMMLKKLHLNDGCPHVKWIHI